MRRWSKRILIVLAVFVLPPVALYFYASWKGEQELRAAIEELDARGEPWRWEELHASRPKLAEQDDVRAIIASVYRKTSGGQLNKAVEIRLDHPPNAVIPPEDFEAFQAEMLALAETLAEAQKIAAMPKARLQIPWAADIASLNMNDVQRTRNVASVLHYAAAWHAQLGDLDAAMDDCLAAVRASQALQDEPLLITHLVRIATSSAALYSLERVLAQGQPAPERLAKLQQVLEDFDSQRAIANGFRGERALSNQTFTGLGEGKVTIGKVLGGPPGRGRWEALIESLYFGSNLKQAHAWTLRHVTDMIKTLDLPEAQRAARWREIDQEARKAPGAARLLTPALQRVMEAHQRSEMLTRCAVAALAAERFRRDHDNHWPQALAELCPKYLAKVPDDPYANQPLQLRATADGIVIYSVGLDGKQSGTYQEDSAAQQSGIKYEFRLWNVPQRRQVIFNKR
jgi:hypothetical protein